MTIPFVTRACHDCKHNITKGWCVAPQLAEVLENAAYQNNIASTEAARDFKAACGHNARWFEPKETGK